MFQVKIYGDGRKAIHKVLTHTLQMANESAVKVLGLGILKCRQMEMFRLQELLLDGWMSLVDSNNWHFEFLLFFLNCSCEGISKHNAWIWFI